MAIRLAINAYSIAVALLQNVNERRFAGRSGSRQSAADIAERRANIIPQRSDRGDEGDRYEGCNQRIFDCRHAAFVADEARDPIHVTLL
jgi:hypothetical protein